MESHVLICDTCGEQTAKDMSIPDGWMQLLDRTGDTHSQWFHFCSLACLSRWVDVRVTTEPAA